MEALVQNAKLASAVDLNKRCGICRYLELWASLSLSPDLPHQVIERMKRRDRVSLSMLEDICVAVLQLPFFPYFKHQVSEGL